MNMVITPYVGIGSLKFGMTIETARGILGNDFGSNKKSPDSDFPTDYYSNGLMLYYKKPGILNAIEITWPSNPVMKNNELLRSPFRVLLDWFSKNDHSTIIEVDGLISLKYGISIGASEYQKNDECICESVLIFEHGYYSKIINSIIEYAKDIYGNKYTFSSQ